MLKLLLTGGSLLALLLQVAYLLRRKLKKLCFSLKRNKHPPQSLMARPHQKDNGS